MAGMFQWKIYLVCISIVLILNLTGAIRAVIVWACRLGPGNDMLDTREHHADAQQALRQSSLVIGCFEKFLYCYFLIRGFESALGCLLLFKAFTHWVNQQEATPASGPDQSAQPPAAQEGPQPSPAPPLSQALIRYYSYAIGNFISLLFAVLICEAVTILVRAVPRLKALLWIG